MFRTIPSIGWIRWVSWILDITAIGVDQVGPGIGEVEQRREPPVDAQDHCYMVHDICYSQCRMRNGCIASGSPNKDQMTRENACETDCDYNLASCLSNLERQNWHSRLGWVVFTWRYTIR